MNRRETGSKVQSLREAVAANIRPGMTIYASGPANALLREIVRQFHKQDLGFTIIASGIRDYVADLIHCGLVRKVIFSASAEDHPRRGPNRVTQRVWRDGSVEMENWSLLSLEQRLQAAALGLRFMPTNSLAGSTMADENRQAFALIEDPFMTGERQGVVRPLQPDLALLHGSAADPQGDAIVFPCPFSGRQAEWAALAARGGVILTVEKLVSDEFIRGHSLLTTVPGCLVRSVSEVPLGAHPHGVFTFGMSGFESYAADTGFSASHSMATRSAGSLDNWLADWVLGCPTEEQYRQKLGSQRILELKNPTAVPAAHGKAAGSAEYDATVMMVIATQREIVQAAIASGYRLVLCGVGVSGVASGLAYYDLKERGYDLQLATGPGVVGFMPQPGNPDITDRANVLTSRMIADVTRIYGVFASGQHRDKCLTVLGAGEIDKNGNVNSTRQGENYLAGSGGSNDNINAMEVIVQARQSRDRLVDRVSYVTCPGGNVRTLVTTMGVFKKPAGDGELTLAGYFPDPGLPTRDERIEAIRSSCGWDLKVSPHVAEVPAPTPRELERLFWLDPPIGKPRESQ